jgi:hypothetical protein
MGPLFRRCFFRGTRTRVWSHPAPQWPVARSPRTPANFPGAGSVKRASVALGVAQVSLLVTAELVRLRLYSVEDMRPINELRMAARWKLGRALAAVQRGERWPKNEPTGAASTRGFWNWAKETLHLDSTVAVGAQRIGCMPDEEMARAFEQARSAAAVCCRLRALAPINLGGTHPRGLEARQQKDAGLSDDQRKTAPRVANIPGKLATVASLPVKRSATGVERRAEAGEARCALKRPRPLPRCRGCRTRISGSRGGRSGLCDPRPRQTSPTSAR